MPKPDRIDRGQMAADYGFALAFMESDPELKKLFNKAVRGTWTPDKFIAQLRDTKWFKTHSANVRNAILQETSDPATYKANVDQMHATVKDTWGAMFGRVDAGGKRLRAWAETAHRMGWSEAQLVDRMTRGINYRRLMRKDRLGGKAAEVLGQIDALESNFGLALGRQWKAAQLEKLMQGNDTVAGVQQRVREMAMRQYKAFAEDIQAGATVKEIAEPYVQRMAELLEMNPHDISLRSDMIQKGLRQRTNKGKPAAMDLADFEDMVRSDRRWQYTDNAREQVGSYATELGRIFGILA